MSEIIPNSKWRKNNGFLRPKVTADKFYIGDAPTSTDILGGETAIFENSSGTNFFSVLSHGSGFGGLLNLAKTNGDSTTPTPSADGDLLGGVIFAGMDSDSAYSYGGLNGIFGQVSGTVASGLVPTKLFIGNAFGPSIQVNANTTSDAYDTYIISDNSSGLLHVDYDADRAYFGVDNSYFDINGYLLLNQGAVGNQGVVNGTGPFNSALQDLLGVGSYSSILNIQNTFSSSPTAYSNGLNVKVGSDYSTAPTAVVGIEATATTVSGNTKGALILAGFYGAALHRGTGTVSYSYGVPGAVYNQAGGTITNAYGLVGQVLNTGAGTITTAYGVQIPGATNSGGGTITTNYGLYINAQTVGGTNYNIYSAGGTADNYFAGYVRTSNTGGFYMNTAGSINNRFVINSPTAANAAAECIITPSSTARIPMVYQGLNGQTANLNQWEDYTGAVLLAVDATATLVWSADTNLYRSAANTLKTDDSFVCADIDTGNGAVELAAGTYTPSLTNGTNVAASTAYQCQYMRVGATVTVSGKVDIDMTSTGAYELGISLPVASNFGATEDCAGVGMGTTTTPSASDGVYIMADTANDRASLNGNDNDTANHTHYFQFTYQII